MFYLTIAILVGLYIVIVFGRESEELKKQTFEDEVKQSISMEQLDDLMEINNEFIWNYMYANDEKIYFKANDIFYKNMDNFKKNNELMGEELINYLNKGKMIEILGDRFVGMTKIETYDKNTGDSLKGFDVSIKKECGVSCFFGKRKIDALLEAVKFIMEAKE